MNNRIAGLVLRQCFSKSRMEVICIRDNVHGFEGQILQVKPGFYQQVLQPRGFAIINSPGFKERLLPDLDRDVLVEKLARKNNINMVMQMIASLNLEFVKTPLFANPNVIKEPITEQEIIDELKNRFKFVINKQELNLNKRINAFGLTTVSVENYFSEDLGKTVSFPLRVVVKRPGKNSPKPDASSTPTISPTIPSS